LKLAKALALRGAFMSTAFQARPSEREGNTSRRGGVPPRCSPTCSPSIATAEIQASSARSCGRGIERAVRLRSERRSNRRFIASRERLRACGLGTDNTTDSGA
jgi:hypothetical protein